MVCAWLIHKKNTGKDCVTEELIIIMQYISFPHNEYENSYVPIHLCINILFRATSAYFRKTIKNMLISLVYFLNATSLSELASLIQFQMLFF